MQAKSLFELVHSTLKKHYQARLDRLSQEAPKVLTFSGDQITSQQVLQPVISVHKSMSPSEGEDGSCEYLVNERAFNSLEEMFCTLLAQMFLGDLKRHKDILKAHFHETQTRPEFIYHLVVTYYKRKQVRKAMLLIEQFLLKGENGSGNDRLYR